MIPEGPERAIRSARSAIRPLTRRLETGDGSATLYSDRYGQAYRSQHGALSESREVFLAGSGVGARLAAGERVRVLEVGFGTGLNFFLTARTALAYPGARLHYTALEHDLLSAPEIAALGYRALLDAEELVNAFLGWRASPVKLETQPFTVGGVRLELLLGDATLTASSGALPRNSFHAVYQDAFSPDANPELWTEGFLGALAAALEAGGTLCSYCVKGEVRRRLAGLGLEVFRRPGPKGGKREVLLARKPANRPENG